MGTISEIFRTHGTGYLHRFGGRMPKSHRKVIHAISTCRTREAGVNYYHCEGCGQTHCLYRGCGNRHGPNCQHAKGLQWLEKRLRRQLPGSHFLVTFTVPEALRGFFRSNQNLCYEALFAASSRALKELIADEKFVGGDLPGFFGVLQTWGRTLAYHPHIHYVVPGGAMDRKTNMWRPAKDTFLVPVKALSKLVRGKFKAVMQKAGALEQIVAMVELCLNFECRTPQPTEDLPKRLRCPSCGGCLVLDWSRLPNGMVIFARGSPVTEPV
jgi:hypothetical protein